MKAVVMVKGDVTDLAFLIKTAKFHQVDSIIHLAYIMGLVDENPSLALSVNCQGSINVFETAYLLGLRKVVWASSNAVFGSPDKYPYEHLPDNAPHYPPSIYGACKSFIERIADYYFEKRNVDSNSPRFVMTYGPGRMRGAGMFSAEMINKPALGLPAEVPYKDEFQNFMYVKDAARCIIMLCNVERTETRSYNVSGDLLTVRNFAEIVKKIIPGADISLEGGKFPVELAWKYDISKIKKEVGFTPNYKAEQGIRESINFVRQKNELPSV
jgi:nucleoside-diphosphate-sugar epimerase